MEFQKGHLISARRRLFLTEEKQWNSQKGNPVEKFQIIGNPVVKFQKIGNGLLLPVEEFQIIGNPVVKFQKIGNPVVEFPSPAGKFKTFNEICSPFATQSYSRKLAHPPTGIPNRNNSRKLANPPSARRFKDSQS